MSPHDRLGSDWLDPRLSFETFEIYDGNRLAHAAALAVAQLPREAYNPLFLYGPARIGKTHLLHAVGNYVFREKSGLTVQIASAGDLAQLASGSRPSLACTVANLDVVLIDDVQLDEKGLDERLAVVLAAMLARDTQIVLARRRSFGDALVPRFDEWPRGLIAELRGRRGPYVGAKEPSPAREARVGTIAVYEVAAAKPTTGSRSGRRPPSAA